MKSQWSNFSDSNRYFPSKIVVCFLDSQYSRIFRSEHHETTTLVTAEAPHFRGLTCEIVPSRRLEQVSIGDGWWLCFIKMADREMFLQLASRYLRLLQDLNVIWFTQDCEMNIIYTMYVDQPSHTYMYIVDIIFNIVYIPLLATLTGSLWLRSYGTYNNYIFVTPRIMVPQRPHWSSVIGEERMPLANEEARVKCHEKTMSEEEPLITQCEWRMVRPISLRAITSAAGKSSIICG